MQQRTRSSWLAAAGALTCLGLAACGSTTAGGMATSEVRMFQTSSIQPMVSGILADVSGSEAAIAPDTVASLTVTVTSIEYLPQADSADSANDGAWQSVALGSPVTVDLTTLPTDSASAIVLASGTVPTGDYGMVRLFVTNPTITFKGPISLGGAVSFDGGTAYSVTIPSEAQTGIKTHVMFSVTAGTSGAGNAAYLMFNPSATYANVTATGAGGITLAPVIQ